MSGSDYKKTSGKEAQLVHPIRNSFGLVLLLAVCGGAQCPQQIWRQQPTVLPILSPAPTRDEIIRTVNRNTDQVRSLSTNSATLDGPGFPSLRASLFVERPGRFRISASHVVTGKELDLGSNDELFWMWIRRSQPPAMYFCRHDRFAGSRMQRMIPLRPEQIVEAFGLIRFDPDGSHEGPFPSGPDRLQMRSVIEGASGPMTRIVVVDAKMGWPLEQHLYDQSGKYLATVRASGHRLDPASGAYLPHNIEMQWPQAQLSLSINVRHYRVNQPIPPEVWTKPEEPGFRNVDLANTGALGGAAMREQMPRTDPRAIQPRAIETTINRQQASILQTPIPTPPPAATGDGRWRPAVDPRASANRVTDDWVIRPLPRY